MSGKVVNLRQRRKQVLRDISRLAADKNAVEFGTPPTMRNLNNAKNKIEARKLDGHKRDD